VVGRDITGATPIVSGITLIDGGDGRRVSRPINDGTGDFAGAIDEVSAVAQPSGLWRMLRREWR
jgi:hypothetical protein